MTRALPSKRWLTASVLILAGILLISASRADRAEAAFEAGVVSVTGYNWSVSTPSVDVRLDGSTNTVRQILQKAQPSAAGQFDLATIPGIRVQRPNGSIVECSGNQVRADNDACPVFSATSSETNMQLKSGTKVPFTQSNPVIRIIRPKDMGVTINPPRKTIASGDTVHFTATVTNQVGKLTYEWNFGDGTSRTTSGNKVSHPFRGDDEEFFVILTVKSTANTREYQGSAVVTVGKVKKKPKKKDKSKKSDEGNTTPTDSSGYIPGYTDGYGDGTGGGTGGPSSGSPSSPGQERPKDKGPQKPVDDGLETVSGQLVDPGTISTVVPPSDSPGAATEEAEPAEDQSDGGGGLSEGAMTAIGIGALLGLGGLAEAGAFAGFRRFRFRP